MKKYIRIALIILALIALFFGSAAIKLYTDWLWFSDLDKSIIFTRIVWARVGLAAVFAALFFIIVYSNLWIARRLAPPPMRSYGGIEVEVRERIQAFIKKGLGIALVAGTAIVSFFVGLQAASKWDEWLKFSNAVPFGVKDPIFGMDIGFYVFRLPFWEFLYNWIFVTVLVAGVAAAVLHYVGEGLDFFANTPRFAKHVKLHLAILLAALFFLKVIGYRLAMYNLVLTRGDIFYGAGYTDIHARIPALWILTIAAIAGGVLVLFNVYRRGIMLAAGAFAGLVALSILVGSAYPAAVEKFSVKPNELEKQRPYITHAIKATRQAFDVDDVASRPFDYTPSISAEQLAGNQAVIQNLRLWDYEPLQRAYNQVQVFQQYYEFNDVDIDRYMVNGDYRQVMISARELAGPPANANTWVNRHLRYTHGYGFAMSPVNEVAAEGLPVYFASEIPVRTTKGLEVEAPQIYFGEVAESYVIVNTKRTEFDYPVGDVFEETKYAGDNGPIIGSFGRRLAFALRFGDANIILSEDLTPRSRILFRRNIAERVRSMFPFLSFDQDPYLVTANGRLYWFHDAYTTTGMYPYSEALEGSGIRYIRNSVKLITDAYTGEVNAYVFDEKDPIIKVYSKAFPGVLRPASDMPEEFRAHVRYPEDLFRVQVAVYSRYHMTETSAFYSGSDLWQMPVFGGASERAAGTAERMEPYYIITRLPNSSTDEFIIIAPLIRPGRNNMVAWMAAKCDPADYGRLIAYEFPRGQTIFGPAQIKARADQDPAISQQLALWNRQDSQVVRGNLLAIPVSNTLLYVEPLYLESTNTQIPEFTRVIVFLGDKPVMEQTIGDALARAVGVERLPNVAGITGQPPVGGTPAAPMQPAQPPGIDALVIRANQQFERAQEAQRRGDWAAYGRELDALRRTLAEMRERSGL